MLAWSPYRRCWRFKAIHCSLYTSLLWAICGDVCLFAKEKVDETVNGREAALATLAKGQIYRRLLIDPIGDGLAKTGKGIAA